MYDEREAAMDGVDYPCSAGRFCIIPPRIFHPEHACGETAVAGRRGFKPAAKRTVIFENTGGNAPETYRERGQGTPQDKGRENPSEESEKNLESRECFCGLD